MCISVAKGKAEVSFAFSYGGGEISGCFGAFRGSRGALP